MKTLVLLSLPLWWSGACLFAGDSPRVTTHFQNTGEEPEGREPVWIFSDRPVKFQAELTAPLGSHLGLYGDLYQVGSEGWSIALSKNLRLSQDLRFETRTQISVPCVLSPLPAVRAPTRLVLKLFLRGQGQAEGSHAGETMELVACPPPRRGERKKAMDDLLTAAGVDSLTLFGRGSSLRHYFRQERISFEDAGVDWPNPTRETALFLADDPPPKPDGLSLPAGKHLVLFLRQGDSALPGVYSSADASGGATVKVTLPALLDHLDDNPRSQQTFLEIVGQALNSKALPAGITANRPSNP